MNKVREAELFFFLRSSTGIFDDKKSFLSNFHTRRLVGDLNPSELKEGDGLKWLEQATGDEERDLVVVPEDAFQRHVDSGGLPEALLHKKDRSAYPPPGMLMRRRRSLDSRNQFPSTGKLVIPLSPPLTSRRIRQLCLVVR